MARTAWVLASIAALALATTGCVVAVRDHGGGVAVVETAETETIYLHEGHPGAVIHDYYYYPDAEVYFDPGLSLWFWYDGRIWARGRHLPRHYQVDEGHRRHFRSDAVRPHELHDRIRAHQWDERRGPERGVRGPDPRVHEGQRVRGTDRRAPAPERGGGRRGRR